MRTRSAVPGLPGRLKAARQAAGLTQYEASGRSGVHPVSIARFEAGHRVPTIATLYKLAGAYGVVAADLLPPPPIGQAHELDVSGLLGERDQGDT